MSSYEMSTAVASMHSAPRFGHTSNIAVLASSNEGEQDDYIRGVKAFSFFIFFFLFLWGAILIVLKFMGPSRVGCAAGGDVLDVAVLRKQYERPERKKMERRSWRVQTAFLVAAVLIPVFSALFLNRGLGTVTESFQKVHDINDSIERVSSRAIDITMSLQRERSRVNQSSVMDLLDLNSYCPNADDINSGGLDLPIIGETIRVSLREIEDFFDEYVEDAQVGLERVAEASDYVDETIYMAYENDWKPRLWVVFLNVINIFLIIGLVLSRNNIAYNPYRALTTYFLLPVFVVCLILAVIMTCGFGATAAVNADFCAGGELPGSPEGTIEDIILHSGVSRQDMVYQLFLYYKNSCSSEDPLAFVLGYEPVIRSTIDATKVFLENVEVTGIADLNEACGADIFPLMSAVVTLKGSLESIQKDVRSAIELASCYSISSILRKIFYGPICNETAQGLTWMFSSMLIISILCLVMLSVRAALYNATLRPERKNRTLRQLKREFNEYKDFMSQFYDDVDEWKLQPSPVKSPDDICKVASYDTDITAKPSDDSSQSNDGPTSPENAAFPDEYSYITPPKNSHPIMDGSLFAYKTRGMLHVLDDEIQPLSSSPDGIMTPGAPRKPFRSFRRTSLGMKWNED